MAKSNIFNPVDNKVDFIQIEHEILDRWETDNTFGQLREKNKGGGREGVEER